MSDSVPVTSEVPQGTVGLLGPLMFFLHINDINQNVNLKLGLSQMTVYYTEK